MFQCTLPVPFVTLTRKLPGHSPTNINEETGARGNNIFKQGKISHRKIPFLTKREETLRALMQPSKCLFSYQCMKCFDPTIEPVAQVATPAELLLAAGNALSIFFKYEYFPGSFPVYSPINSSFRSSNFFTIGLSYPFIYVASNQIFDQSDFHLSLLEHDGLPSGSPDRDPRDDIQILSLL